MQMSQFKFNTGHLGKLVFDKGIDEVLIEIKSVKDIENMAAVEIIFTPIAGDYTKYVKNIRIVKGVFTGTVAYNIASRANLLKLFNKTNKRRRK